MWLETGKDPRELGELRRRDPMNYELLEALNQIAREKNVDREVVIETVMAGLLQAARRRLSYLLRALVQLAAACMVCRCQVHACTCHRMCRMPTLRV